jgi:hypothetical protein
VEPEPHALGQIYIIYGGPDLGGDDGVFEADELDGTNGFTIIRSASTSNDIRIGWPSGIGDLNGDGYDDVGIDVNPTNATNAWAAVLFGGPNVAPTGLFDLRDIDGCNGFRVIRSNGNVSSTKSARGGDINHDGVDDGVFAVYWNDVILGESAVGVAGQVDTAQLDGRDGFRFLPVGFGARARTGVGDVNGDGIDDVGSAIGFFNNDGCDVGKIVIVFGRRMGDGDLDADVDFVDFGAFQSCFGDPANGDVPDECHPFDFDKDNDVDLDDYAAFEEAFGTPP